MLEILIVDDEERIRATYQNLLQNQGHKTSLASNAVDAKEMLVQHHYDLVLMDINMGSINGEILYEAARSFHPQIKIMVSSVYPIDEQNDRIPRADAYYDKADSLSVLLKTISSLEISPQKSVNKKNILVIDDDRKQRLVYHELLTRAGYYPMEFYDCEKVYSYLEKQIHKIDLIILDLQMPQITGSDFFDYIKTHYPSAKVLISSNYDLSDQETAVFTADAYFDKSDGPNILLSKIDKIFNNQMTQLNI